MNQVNTSTINTIDEQRNTYIDKLVSQYLLAYRDEAGAESDVDFIKTIIGGNLNFSGKFNPSLFARCRTFERVMKKLSSSETPLAGHRVKIVGNDYDACEAGLLCDTYRDWSEGKAAVCQHASGHISSPEILEGYGLPLSVSGGTHVQIDRSKLERLDSVSARYWFWGCTPRGDGGIYMTFKVTRWIFRVS